MKCAVTVTDQDADKPPLIIADDCVDESVPINVGQFHIIDFAAGIKDGGLEGPVPVTQETPQRTSPLIRRYDVEVAVVIEVRNVHIKDDVTAGNWQDHRVLERSVSVPDEQREIRTKDVRRDCVENTVVVHITQHDTVGGSRIVAVRHVVGRWRVEQPLTGRLSKAALLNLFDRVLPQRLQIAQRPASVACGHHRRFAAIQHAVVVEVREDREAGQSRFARILNAVLVDVVELNSRDAAWQREVAEIDIRNRAPRLSIDDVAARLVQQEPDEVQRRQDCHIWPSIIIQVSGRDICDRRECGECATDSETTRTISRQNQNVVRARNQHVHVAVPVEVTRDQCVRKSGDSHCNGSLGRKRSRAVIEQDLSRLIHCVVHDQIERCVAVKIACRQPAGLRTNRHRHRRLKRAENVESDRDGIAERIARSQIDDTVTIEVTGEESRRLRAESQNLTGCQIAGTIIEQHLNIVAAKERYGDVSDQVVVKVSDDDLVGACHVRQNRHSEPTALIVQQHGNIVHESRHDDVEESVPVEIDQRDVPQSHRARRVIGSNRRTTDSVQQQNGKRVVNRTRRHCVDVVVAIKIPEHDSIRSASNRPRVGSLESQISRARQNPAGRQNLSNDDVLNRLDSGQRVSAIRCRDRTRFAWIKLPVAVEVRVDREASQCGLAHIADAVLVLISKLRARDFRAFNQSEIDRRQRRAIAEVDELRARLTQQHRQVRLIAEFVGDHEIDRAVTVEVATGQTDRQRIR